MGAGVQGHSHVPVLGLVLPGVDLVVYDSSRERADSLASSFDRRRSQVCRQTIDQDTWLLLSTEGDFYGYLKSSER